jgi:hypothetical protein
MHFLSHYISYVVVFYIFNFGLSAEGKHAVAQLVEALRHKPESRGFVS